MGATFAILGSTPGDDLEGVVQHAISSEWFSYLAVPLIFIFLGILSKLLGRREGDVTPHPNEFAVGTSVFVMTTGKIVSDLCAPHAHLFTLFTWIILAFLCIFSSAAADRHMSWVPGDDGLATNQKRWLKGIILPDVVAILFFGAYQYMKIKFK